MSNNEISHDEVSGLNKNNWVWELLLQINHKGHIARLQG